MDSHNYLHKFAHLTVDLPNNKHAQHDDDYTVFCNKLYSHFGISPPKGGRELLSTMIDFSKHLDLSLREIEKSFTYTALYYASYTTKTYTDEFLVGLLSTLKTKHPELYTQLANGTVSYPDLSEEINLTQFNSTLPTQKSYATDFLKFCLLSDVDLVDRPSLNKSYYSEQAAICNLDRKRIIPFICNGIERFSPIDKIQRS